MKKILFAIPLLMILMPACKKSDQKMTGVYDVSFVFSPHDNPSEIIYKNHQTGEVKNYTNQTVDLTINNKVRVGDKFFLGMKGKADGLDASYSIKVLYNGNMIAATRAFGMAGKRDQDLQLDKTFTELDFSK